MRFLKGIIVSIIGLVFSLGLVEVGLRFFSAKSVSTPAWNDRPTFYFRDEAATTLQDYSYSKEKPENTFRIAVIGDSYTFAPYMQFTDTFVKKLEQMLNLNNTALKAEVINYGVPAYSTSHEVAVVAQAIKEGADLVLIQVTLNDPELKPYRPQGISANMLDRFGAFDPSDTPGWKGILLRNWYTLRFVATRIHNTNTYREYSEYFIDLFENPKSWGKFIESFEAIHKACLEDNKKIAVVVFPLFGLPLDDTYPFKVIHDKLDNFFVSKNITKLDLLESFKGLPIDRMQVIPGVDRHPNEIAHRIAAENIYLWLEKQNFIPQELKIKMRYSERLGITGKGIIQ